MSGSPVLARQTIHLHGFVNHDGKKIDPLLTLGSHYYLVGLVSAHWDIDPTDINSPEPRLVTSGVNMGLAVVVPGHKILEIIEGKELSDLRGKRAQESIEYHKLRGKTPPEAKPV